MKYRKSFPSFNFIKRQIYFQLNVTLNPLLMWSQTFGPMKNKQHAMLTALCNILSFHYHLNCKSLIVPTLLPSQMERTGIMSLGKRRKRSPRKRKDVCLSLILSSYILFSAESVQLFSLVPKVPLLFADWMRCKTTFLKEGRVVINYL